jgi:hypothetical protein
MNKVDESGSNFKSLLSKFTQTSKEGVEQAETTTHATK